MGQGFLKPDLRKNQYMLQGKFQKRGYDWWWHSFTGTDVETKEEKTFFIEFFIVNPKLMQLEPVLGMEQRKPSYLMIKCGAWGKEPVQLHRFFSMKDVTVTKFPIEIEAQNCYLSEERLKGFVKVEKPNEENMTDAGEMSFDLKINKSLPYNVGYGTSALFRKLKAFQMYWNVSGMKTGYTGNITLNGRTYQVQDETSYGYADKNWGSDFTSPWVWLSSNHIVRKSTMKEVSNSAFDIGGGRPKVFFIPFKRKLLGAYALDEYKMEFNFSKFWHRTKTRFQFGETKKCCRWIIEQKDRKHKIVTRIECPKEEMLWVHYESPDGMRKHKKLWNGGTGYGSIEIYEKNAGSYQLKDEFICDHVGCEYGEYFLKRE